MPLTGYEVARHGAHADTVTMSILDRLMRKPPVARVALYHAALERRRHSSQTALYLGENTWRRRQRRMLLSLATYARRRKSSVAAVRWALAMILVGVYEGLVIEARKGVWYRLSDLSPAERVEMALLRQHGGVR